MQRQVVVIAGPSGSGESTITQEIVRQYPSVTRLVTATTRPPRNGEKNAVDYYFFTREAFMREKAAGRILESTYIENRDTYYGTYAPDLEEKLKKGFIVIINPDIVGARYYKGHYRAATIFIVPENIHALENRIRERSPELSEEEVMHRLENAAREMENEKSFYDYVVTNVDGKLDEAVGAVVEILRKEGYNL